MSAESLIIYNCSRYHLRSINRFDNELLRKWKNKHKQYFFHDETISAEQQLKWFELFRGRKNDHMYILEELCGEKPHKVGAMGWRIKEHSVDIYNIMRGETSQCDGYSMGQALCLMISFVRTKENLSVRCIVRSNNPALEWYKSIGMEIVGKGSRFYELEFRDYDKLPENRTKDTRGK